MSAGKIVSISKLARLRKGWRKTGRKVVFTNGCYDLLHAGHVHLLEKAKAFGDILIVGLNSDASVRKLGKSPERPINPQSSRARVVAALESVDYVALFDSETPAALIRTLKPDILVKGADYQAGEIVGRLDAGKTVRIPLKKGFSTTGLIRKIKKFD
ncbi:MAG: adenylyltransferase/cytidyltransferase family protein [Elusimicrobia bacterium]|nr:adenylyltransferase/cytidyltransferase family protein [Elusimicrobiota bacterium]